MRILGIDPGYATLGWAVVEADLRVVAFGVVETTNAAPFGERLLQIHREIDLLITQYRPDCAALEKIFFTKNRKTAIDVAKSIGSITLTMKLRSIPAFEYNPTQVKQAITGYGSASKKQMQTMIMRLFNMPTPPRPDDVADALAIAACHSFSIGPGKGRSRR